MKNVITILTLVAASVAAFAHGADLNFTFTTNINGSPLQYNTNYTVNGTAIQAQYLGYYIGNIRLVKSDATEEAFSDIVLVKNGQANTLTLEVDNGTYTAIKFDIGVDSALNFADPTLQPVNSPLALQTPSHHWSWNSGYIFFRLDGKVDTSANQSAGTVKDLVFHLGLLPQVRTVTKTVSFTANGTHTSPNQVDVAVTLNLEDFLAGVDLKTDYYTMSFDVPVLATTVADNLQNAFEVSAQLVNSVADKNLFANSVKLYPNPAAENVVVALNNAQLQKGNLLVTDIAGKVINTIAIENALVNIEVNNLPTGLYFIRHSEINAKGLKLIVE
jgi:hypothetical protein